MARIITIILDLLTLSSLLIGQDERNRSIRQSDIRTNPKFSCFFSIFSAVSLERVVFPGLILDLCDQAPLDSCNIVTAAAIRGQLLQQLLPPPQSRKYLKSKASTAFMLLARDQEMTYISSFSIVRPTYMKYAYYAPVWREVYNYHLYLFFLFVFWLMLLVHAEFVLACNFLAQWWSKILRPSKTQHVCKLSCVSTWKYQFSYDHWS